MEDLRLTKEQKIGYNLIELRILFQRSIEILDELKSMDHRSKNNSLNSQLKALIPSLEKETKKYNEIYEVESEGTSHFYNVTVTNSQYIMSYSLLEKALICSFLIAHEIDSKSVEGIINKVIKNNNLKK
jgi:hypothetical protein